MSQAYRTDQGGDVANRTAPRSAGTDNMIRVMHVFPSFEVGGSQVRFAKLAKELGPGYRHLIVSLNDRWDALEVLLAGVDTCEAVKTGLPLDFGPKHYLQIRRLLRDMKVDVLMTYNWGAVDFALANRIFQICPHIDMEDGFGPDEANGRLPRRNFARWLAYSGAKALVAPSRVLEGIARREWHVSSKTVRFLPNGIDCTRFDRGPDKVLLDELGLASLNGPLIGTIATLRKEKNLHRLIDAFGILGARHPDAHLVIAGDGGERAALEAYAREKPFGGNIHFTGRINEPERIVGAFDIFAMSSDTEQMPFSVLEAMASSKPVASVDVGDVKNMLAPENADHICDKSAEALAAVIERFLSDGVLCSRLGEANARQVRAVYGLPAMVTAYDALFREVARK